MPNIDTIQKEIINEFKVFEDDRESMLEHLMDLADILPSLDSKNKIESNKIKGCLSEVWVVCKNENGKLFFNGDSNTKITKGLLSLLVRIFSGQTAENILDANLYYMQEIGLNNLIGSQRTSGYNSMVNQILKLAAIEKQKNY